MTSPTNILRIQDVTQGTAAGMCLQQTTNGGPDLGAQYVQHEIVEEIAGFKYILSRFLLMHLEGY